MTLFLFDKCTDYVFFASDNRRCEFFANYFVVTFCDNRLFKYTCVEKMNILI